MMKKREENQSTDRKALQNKIESQSNSEHDSTTNAGNDDLMIVGIGQKYTQVKDYLLN